MKEFKDYITKVKKYSPKTVLVYCSALEKFLSIYDYKTATKQEISIYLSSQNGNAIKNTTIASLKLFYKFKVRNGDISYNPMDVIPYSRVQNKSIIPIQEKEMENILHESNFMSKQDYILFETLYLTGMRISELHSLSVKDIMQNTIKITGKGNKQRMVHLPKYAIENLLSISGNDKVCTYTYDTLRKRMSFYMKDFKRCNLTSSTKLSSHGLRHAFATHLHKSGAGIIAIKDMLGHSTCAVTQVYTHLDMAYLKEQHKLMRR